MACKQLDFVSAGIKSSMALVVLTMPLTPKWGTYAFCLLGLFALLKFREDPKWVMPPASILWLASIYFIRILGLIWAIDFPYGATSLESDSPLLLIPLAFLFLKIDKKTQAYTEKVFILMCTALMVYAIARLFITVTNSEYPALMYLRQHLTNPSEHSDNLLNWKFGHYSFMSVILIYGLILLAFNRSQVVTKPYVVIYTAGALLFMVLTGSRAGIILLLITTGMYFLWLYKVRFTATTTITIVSLLAISLAFFWYVKKNKYHENDFVRYQFAMIAIDAIEKKPLLGFGTGSNKQIMQNIETAERLGFAKTKYYGAEINHPHNQYLTELLQFGLLGSIPFFAFIFQSFRESIRNNSIKVFALLTIFSIFMLVEAPLNSNKGIIPFVFLICLLSFVVDRQRPEDTSLK